MAVGVAWYNSLPSYRAMLDIEGVDGPADVALLGDEKALDAGLKRLEECGATELHAQIVPTDPGSPARTFEWLASRAVGAAR